MRERSLVFETAEVDGDLRAPDLFFPQFPTSRLELTAQMLRTSPLEYVRARALLAQDIIRAGFEITQLRFDPIYKQNGRYANGKSEILIPGFLGGSWTMRFLADWLKRSDFERVNLPLLANTNVEPIEVLAERIIWNGKKEKLRSGKKAGVIGHSRGGYAIWAASKLYPGEFGENFDNAIILGAPPPRKVHPDVGWLYLLTQFAFGADDFRLIEKMGDDWRLPRIPGLKMTLIIGVDDPIVKPRNLPQQEGEFRLRGASHFGMPANSLVYKIMHSRLFLN